jgi:hypothetical protein
MFKCLKKIFKKGEGITDATGVELVNMLKEDFGTDIFPATIFEFTDYLKRGKITALRTLVRTVFSCPKTLAHSFKLDVGDDSVEMDNHDWDGKVLNEH